MYPTERECISILTKCGQACQIFKKFKESWFFYLWQTAYPYRTVVCTLIFQVMILCSLSFRENLVHPTLHPQLVCFWGHGMLALWIKCYMTVLPGMQTRYLSDLLHQQILQNLEIYPKKGVICDIFYPEYWIFSISIHRVGMISQFTSLCFHITLYHGPNILKLQKMLNEMWNSPQIKIILQSRC